MRSLAIILHCTIHCAIGCGLGLGIGLLVAGRMEQGIGLAIIGGTFGFILAISSILYNTGSAETFCRGSRLFLKVTAAKNIPFGDKLVTNDGREIRGKYRQIADTVALGNRMATGMKIGAAVSVVPAVLIAIYIQDANRDPDPIVIEVLKRSVIGFFLIAFVGGTCGAACGALTVAGVHRRNIFLGTVLGTSIGVGLSVAIVQGARVPAWQVYVFACGVFGWIGMVFGLFSDDNFRSTESDVRVDDLPDV